MNLKITNLKIINLKIMNLKIMARINRASEN
jgi:hypothetical protein